MKKFVVFSQGCCGSKHMVSCLRQAGLERVLANYPHRRFPPKNSEGFPVLYMYADPRNILISSFNNGFKWAAIHCENVGGDLSYFQTYPKEGIKKILEMQYDPLGLKEHLENWIQRDTSYPIMILKYESLEKPDTFQKILDFFKVPDYAVKYEWKPRLASYLNLPAQQQCKFYEMFEGLIDIQSKLPDCFIKV